MSDKPDVTKLKGEDSAVGMFLVQEKESPEKKQSSSRPASIVSEGVVARGLMNLMEEERSMSVKMSTSNSTNSISEVKKEETDDHVNVNDTSLNIDNTNSDGEQQQNSDNTSASINCSINDSITANLNISNSAENINAALDQEVAGNTQSLSQSASGSSVGSANSAHSGNASTPGRSTQGGESTPPCGMSPVATPIKAAALTITSDPISPLQEDSSSDEEEEQKSDNVNDLDLNYDDKAGNLTDQSNSGESDPTNPANLSPSARFRDIVQRRVKPEIQKVRLKKKKLSDSKRKNGSDSKRGSERGSKASSRASSTASRKSCEGSRLKEAVKQAVAFRKSQSMLDMDDGDGNVGGSGKEFRKTGAGILKKGEGKTNFLKDLRDKMGEDDDEDEEKDDEDDAKEGDDSDSARGRASVDPRATMNPREFQKSIRQSSTSSGRGSAKQSSSGKQSSGSVSTSRTSGSAGSRNSGSAAAAKTSTRNSGTRSSDSKMSLSMRTGSTSLRTGTGSIAAASGKISSGGRIPSPRGGSAKISTLSAQRDGSNYRSTSGSRKLSAVCENNQKLSTGSVESGVRISVMSGDEGKVSGKVSGKISSKFSAKISSLSNSSNSVHSSKSIRESTHSSICSTSSIRRGTVDRMRSKFDRPSGAMSPTSVNSMTSGFSRGLSPSLSFSQRRTGSNPSSISPVRAFNSNTNTNSISSGSNSIQSNSGYIGDRSASVQSNSGYISDLNKNSVLSNRSSGKNSVHTNSGRTTSNSHMLGTPGRTTAGSSIGSIGGIKTPPVAQRAGSLQSPRTSAKVSVGPRSSSGPAEKKSSITRSGTPSKKISTPSKQQGSSPLKPSSPGSTSTINTNPSPQKNKPFTSPSKISKQSAKISSKKSSAVRGVSSSPGRCKAEEEDPYLFGEQGAGEAFVGTEGEQAAKKESLEKLNSINDDTAVAFEMLDKKKQGAIQWEEARYWLRCIGWCCTDVELDHALCTIGGPEKTLFRLDELRSLASGNTGITVKDKLANKLFVEDRMVALSRSNLISREDLQGYMTKTGEAMRNEDFEELMDIIGYGQTTIAMDIDVAEFSRELVAKIKTPPNVPTNRGRMMV